MKITKKIFALIVMLCAGSIFGCAGTAQPGAEPISRSGIFFDTVIQVTLYDPSRQDALDHCFDMAAAYEQYFSTKRQDSDVCRINRADKDTPALIHDETAELLEAGIKYAKLSDGKFDITIGKLSSLWDFHASSPSVPKKAQIEAAVKHIGYQQLVVLDAGSKAKKGMSKMAYLESPDTAVDLGGIAKGYIADKMKEYLISQGIQSGLINLGGNVLAIGAKPDGSAYTIGIQKPFAQTGEPAAAVSIKDQTVVTSGIYERYFMLDGKRYHHILDVSTGYPYDNGLYSVSIICKSSLDGDGLSTACFALGLDDGMELIEALDDTEAIFITNDNKLHCSSGIGKNVPMQEIGF